jgi:hypothetical protein
MCLQVAILVGSGPAFLVVVPCVVLVKVRQVLFGSALVVARLVHEIICKNIHWHVRELHLGASTDDFRLTIAERVAPPARDLCWLK